jgi:hypothetical protein
LRNLPRHAPELGEVFIAQLIAGGARGVCREIDGADRLAVRSSTGTAIERSPPLELLVRDGKSLFPVSANTIEQRPHVDDGVLGAKRFRCLLR